MLDIRDDEPHVNPLDNVEDILTHHNWVYSRPNNDELMVKVAGRSCCYSLYFIWHEHMNALQYVCEYDLQITQENRLAAYDTIMTMNAASWIGHFEINNDTQSPAYRYTLLQGGASQVDLIEDLVEMSLAQCERYQPVFQILSQDSETNSQTLSLAMMETSGES